MKKCVKFLSKYIVLFVTCLTLIGLSALNPDKVKADYYGPWVVHHRGPIQTNVIIYGGGKKLLQKYRIVTYRRVYVDDGGNTTNLYKTEIQKLGLESPYN